MKFLYEVNSDTRKLIKRSSRESDLKKKFDIGEMSSISTLEVAWFHVCVPWPMYREDETDFCWRVAKTNKLEFLKWIREEKKYRWDESTTDVAATRGNMEMVKYCVANKCPIGTGTCARVAGNGDLECLKYLREEGKAPWDSETAARAADDGHLHILEYLVERKYDKYSEYVGDQAFYKCACEMAARKGHLDCLKYLHETAKAPWNEGAVEKAHENNHPECVQYCLDNDCPLPYRWFYEDGELIEEFYDVEEERWNERTIFSSFRNR